MSKKNKTVQQIKAESKNKQTTTKKKNRREISDCRKKRIYPSTRISKFLFALPDRLRRNSTFVRKSYRKISEINKKVNTKKKEEKKRKTREIRDSWKKNNRLHWAFSDFFSSFFFWQNVMFSPIFSHAETATTAYGPIRPSRPSTWNTHRSVEKERRGKQKGNLFKSTETITLW